MKARTDLRKRCVSILIVFALLASLLSGFVVQQVSAYETKTGTVTATSLNVRSGPGTSYSVVGSLFQGDTVTVVGEENDSADTLWYQIQSGSISGYVSAEYIELDVRIGTVNADSLNVRSGPGTSYDSLGKLSQGETVTITGEVTGSDGTVWYQIDYNGGTGYVSSAYIILQTTSSSSSSSTETTTLRTGVVTVSSLNVRSGPGTSYSKIGSLFQGDSVTIIGETTDSSGDLWYQINYSTVTGYVSAAYVMVQESAVYVEDPDFEASISDFPESYKDGLRQLHALYPNWSFKAVDTGSDWSDALAAESELGVNLVSSSSVSSWKSTQDGAYDWDTSTWIGLDGSSWVAASEEIIAYYLDPRNYLDSSHVFAFLDYSYDPTKQTESGLKKVVSGTFLDGDYTEDEKTYSYVDQIMSAADLAGMNPYLIAATIIQEQGVNGTGNCISGTVSGYEGYYNYFNIGAYATSSMTAVQRGLWFAMGSGTGSTSYERPWDTRYKSILGGAEWYVANYVDQNQGTLYTKKFNVNGSSSYAKYTHQYMTNVQGAYSEAYLLSTAYDDAARAEELVFEIPVFRNMPDSAVTQPTTDGSPNTQLASLSVVGYSLTPSFSTNTTNYDVVVSEDTTTVTVNATAKDSSAKVTGTGTYAIGTGVTTISVKVTAENGSTRTYTINVARNSDVVGTDDPIDDVDESDPANALNTSMTITGDTIHGLSSVPMSVSTFTKELGVQSGYSATVYDSSGKARTSGNVCTGDIVKITRNGSTVASYTIVIYGDANGDGEVDVADALRIQKYAAGMVDLTGAAKTAADANRDGTVDVADALRIKKEIVGLATITQK